MSVALLTQDQVDSYLDRRVRPVLNQILQNTRESGCVANTEIWCKESEIYKTHYKTSHATWVRLKKEKGCPEPKFRMGKPLYPLEDVMQFMDSMGIKRRPSCK